MQSKYFPRQIDARLDTYFELSRVYSEYGDLENSLKAIRASLAFIKSTNFSAFVDHQLELADVLLSLGRIEEARQALQVYEHNKLPRLALVEARQYYYCKGRTLAMEGQYENALHTLDTAALLCLFGGC